MRFNNDLKQGNNSNQTSSNTTSSNTTEDFNTILQNYNKMVQEYSDFRQRMKEEFKTVFEKASSTFFQLVPEVKSIIWTQYTPYFNDGDTCYFSVHEFSFSNFIPDSPIGYFYDSYQDDDNCEDNSWSYSSWGMKKSSLSAEKIELCNSFESLINANEEFMQEILGDHVLVHVTANGVEVSDYDHD